MSSRPYRLMIDPGHGGGDPGAISRKLAIKEKNITLPVALYMHDIAKWGDFLFEPHLTRKEDVFVSLPCRCNLSNLWAAHAFVSIHCNAREHKGRPGIEIEAFHYKNSKKGREFANIALGILLQEISKYIKVISRGVKIGQRWSKKKQKYVPFYVLKYTTMSAILIELGFITDDEEAIFLINAMNQKMMAGAIAEAAELFFEGGAHEWNV